MTTTLLEVRNLKTYFDTPKGFAKAVDDISFEIPKGGTFALVGESGCGKTAIALSIIQLIEQYGGKVTGGQVLLNGEDILQLNELEKRKIRGGKISMIFQEPMSSLNPVFTIGEQIVETIKLHQGLGYNEAKASALEMLERVGMRDPELIFKEYPHRLSGGMQQRVMIAMALVCKPDILIADEPTTALDVTIQAQILELIRQLQREMDTSILLITHNLALVYRNAEYTAVMYAGKILEIAPTKLFFRNPMHPYSIQLLRSIPRPGSKNERLETIKGSVPAATDYPVGCRFSGRCPREMQGCATVEPDALECEEGHRVSCHLHDPTFMSRPNSIPIARGADALAPVSTQRIERSTLIEVKNLKTYYRTPKGFFKGEGRFVKAVDGIDLTIKKGTTVALVGESGCGKTTVGKSIIRLIEPTEGEILYKGNDLAKHSNRELKPFRSKMQIIFQDSVSSLDPRRTIKEIVGEGLNNLKPDMEKDEMLEQILRTLERVGLTREIISRYPRELSGGQRQRIGIARALAVDPEFIVCDEALSSLDVSVQAQILNLLKSIQKDSGISLLFITHDLSVVEYIADEVVVMYKGRIVEHGSTGEIFAMPRHEHTKELLASIPEFDTQL